MARDDDALAARPRLLQLLPHPGHLVIGVAWPVLAWNEDLRVRHILVPNPVAVVDAGQRRVRAGVGPLALGDGVVVVHVFLGGAFPVQNLAAPDHSVEDHQPQALPGHICVEAAERKGLELGARQHPAPAIQRRHVALPSVVGRQGDVVVGEVVVVAHGRVPLRSHILQLLGQIVHDHLNGASLVVLARELVARDVTSEDHEVGLGVLGDPRHALHDRSQ
mmetsp:Transcript_9283/g.23932  ORF Transcript_9283/g.23932 Transcript_9283/m.23932 type:complete len:220 (+) Transcript_9283:1046-1705(+)